MRWPCNHWTSLCTTMTMSTRLGLQKNNWKSDSHCHGATESKSETNATDGRKCLHRNGGFQSRFQYQNQPILSTVFYPNVSICVTSPQYNNSYRKPGGILMHAHESFGFPSPSLPVSVATNIDAFVNNKGLDAYQTAFAIKYKSHHHVRLTGEIVALMQASDWCSTYIQTPLGFVSTAGL